MKSLFSCLHQKGKKGKKGDDIMSATARNHAYEIKVSRKSGTVVKEPTISKRNLEACKKTAEKYQFRK